MDQAVVDAFEPVKEAATETSEKAKKPRPRRGKKPVKAAEANEITFMVRYLPRHYTPASLMQEVQVFLPAIDFFYLPTDFESQKSLGYAFFNFNDKDAATRFEEFWLASGISQVLPEPGEAPIENPVLIQPSRVQGFAANVERIRTSSVMKGLPAYLKPIIFKNGVPQSLSF